MDDYSFLTREQEKWIKGVQRALDKPGGEGLGFYVIGDLYVEVYDIKKKGQIETLQDREYVDFCTGVDRSNAGLGNLIFPNQVLSTSG